MTVDDLIVAERLPASYKSTVDHWWRCLAQQIVQWRKSAGRTMVIGVNGAQGSGKSTLCRFLQSALLPEYGLSAATVALDDFYFPRSVRERLAVEAHPLFRTRGVPGTHDVDLGIFVLDELANGRDALIPRFSKAIDDRLPQADWTEQTGDVDIIFFEGWCVGARPQDSASLDAPLNMLEIEADPQGIWRRLVNATLETSYARWFARIDRLIMLKPPSFDHVLRNRLLQESKLRATNPGASAVMDDDALKRFVSHYERLTRHMFMDLPDRADIIFDLDENQMVKSSRGLSCL